MDKNLQYPSDSYLTSTHHSTQKIKGPPTVQAARALGIRGNAASISSNYLMDDVLIHVLVGDKQNFLAGP